MDDRKRKQLKADGWQVRTTADFIVLPQLR